MEKLVRHYLIHGVILLAIVGRSPELRKVNPCNIRFGVFHARGVPLPLALVGMVRVGDQLIGNMYFRHLALRGLSRCEFFKVYERVRAAGKNFM
jgi:hypothetical protein